MRPLSPAERAAILAEHPGTTEADLDRLLGLMAQRFSRPPPQAPPRRSGAAAPAARAPEDDEVEALVAERFPRMGEAIRRAAESGEA